MTTATQFLNPSILSLVGKKVHTLHPVIFFPHGLQKTIPAGWHGTVVSEFVNHCEEQIVSVCWEATGDVDVIRREEVEIVR